MKRKIYISFVIPARDEEKSIGPLYEEIKEAMSNLRKSYEIIFIDDGSVDKTFERMASLQKKDKKVKIIKLRGNWGKSIALQAGFEETKGEIIITLDADLQDNPREIPRFLKKLDEGYDFVSGWKKVRLDPRTKVILSRIFNHVVSILSGIKIHDINCGFKAFRKDVIKNISLYGELYRFIPILVSSQNYKVSEIIIKHRPRKYGKSKFGWERTTKGFLDFLTIIFLTGYLSRPGHFFGSFGLISFSSGFMIGLYITYLRIATGSIQNRHPLLYLGMLLMIIGIQLITTGLLGEMVTSYSQKRSTENSIEKKLL